jgi:hypothetical protein
LIGEVLSSLVHDVLAEFSDLLNVLGVFLIFLTVVEEHQVRYNGKDLPSISEYHERHQIPKAVPDGHVLDSPLGEVG